MFLVECIFSSIHLNSGFPTIFNCKIHIILLPLKTNQFANHGGGAAENEEGLFRSFLQNKGTEFWDTLVYTFMYR